MSLQSVKAWLAANAPDLRLIEVDGTTATVETAAKALGVEPGRIAKTLAVRAGEQLFMLCTRGDARLDNRKCKDELGARPRMLGAEETLEITGHPVGGVCPFGLKQPLPVYLDVSLKAFEIVYPAGRGRHGAAVRARRPALGRSMPPARGSGRGVNPRERRRRPATPSRR